MTSLHVTTMLKLAQPAYTVCLPHIMSHDISKRKQQKKNQHLLIKISADTVYR